MSAGHPEGGSHRVLSIHWGFGFGGVAKYATILEQGSLPLEVLGEQVDRFIEREKQGL